MSAITGLLLGELEKRLRKQVKQGARFLSLADAEFDVGFDYQDIEGCFRLACAACIWCLGHGMPVSEDVEKTLKRWKLL
jgi:hypothetical protein